MVNNAQHHHVVDITHPHHHLKNAAELLEIPTGREMRRRAQSISSFTHLRDPTTREYMLSQILPPHPREIAERDQ